MNIKTIGKIAALALTGGLMALPALAQQAPAGGAPVQGKAFPVNVQWSLASLNGAAVVGEHPTVQLDAQLRMRGFAGCNTFSATAYPMKNQGITVGPVAVTNKVCDKAVMDAEKTYLLGLRTALQWDVKDGFLYIRSERSELKFERALF
jgi:heat shock protein HslJ